MRLTARGRVVEFPRRPLIMGIVNLGADSFSGDGIPEPARAAERARAMIGEGADVIDIGAESARTNRDAIGEQEEIDRLCTFLSQFSVQTSARDTAPADKEQLFPPLLSINTWRPAVARAVLAAGGDVLNDIGGLPDAENARICAAHSAALVIMHSIGAPKVPHTDVRYPDVMVALETFFEEKLRLAAGAGLSSDALLLDPGIDFAKQRDDNLRIYRELGRLHRFGRPILLPVSRKTVIGDVLGLNDPAERDPGTVASIVAGALRGASIFRVHNVRAAYSTLKTVQSVEQAAGG